MFPPTSAIPPMLQIHTYSHTTDAMKSHHFAASLNETLVSNTFKTVKSLGWLVGWSLNYVLIRKVPNKIYDRTL
jgi:hypothetical protein